MTKDLYATLGVAKNASDDEIRRAYRKLARKLHPDVNPGDKASEERFKEVTAAHEVLADAEKRKLYDEFGEDSLRGGFDPDRARAYERARAQASAGGNGRGAPGGFGGGGFGDIFDLFGGRHGFPGQDGPTKGEDISGVVNLDFVDALRGTEMRLTVTGPASCEACNGSGEQRGAKATTCADCKGKGRRPMGFGGMRLEASCPTCGGSGKDVPPCTTCRGTGEVARERAVSVRIPAGADDGSRLRVPGAGGPGPGGPGDLVLETRVKPHPFFRRDGLDLILRLPVTLEEALGGASVEVPTPTGTVSLRIPPRTQPGTRMRLKGKGVARGGKVGDLYAEVDLRLPEKDDARLTEAARAASSAYEKPVREGLRL